MKSKIFAGIIFCISVLTFSCSNGQDVKQYEDIYTLRDKLGKMDEETKWTSEMEENRLQKELSLEIKLPEDLTVTPSLISTIKNYQEPVYPSIEGFGSLDNSILSSSTYKKINSFNEKLSENVFDGLESFFLANYSFNYVFFIDELRKGWKTHYNEDFPHYIITKDEGKNNDENKKENQDDEASEIKEPEKVKYKKLFSKWIIGKPVYSENLISVPVRFFCNRGTIDVIIYMSSLGDNQFYQIVITRWR